MLTIAEFLYILFKLTTDLQKNVLELHVHDSCLPK